ncbi:MAG: acyl carrier protein [Deltaproteobacteria bacterium]|nr:acyl carrier protein [Deltaproteobacteria bacterium]
MNANDIEKVLTAEIVVDSDKKSLGPDEDLLEQGMIDSLKIIKLIEFMESKFGIKIVDEEIIPENFMSINSMVKFIERQLEIA